MGVSREILRSVGGDATVENSDQTFQENIPAGDIYVLDDYEFEFQDQDGNVIDTQIRPAMVNETFIVSGQTEFFYNLNINSVFQQVVLLNINDDINININ